MSRKRALGSTKHAYLATLFSILLTVIIAVVAAGLSHQWVRTTNQSRFQLRAEDLLMVLNRGMERDLEAVHAIQTLFAARENVTRAEFRKGLADSLTRHPEIQALEWMIRLPDAYRGKFEDRMRAEGFAGFRISELDEKGGTRIAPRRPEYFVIHYVEPAEDNYHALGYSVLGAPAARKALEQALSGKLGISPWFTLRQGETGFVVYLPLKTPWSEAKVPPPASFAVGVFRIKKLLDIALRDIRGNHVDFVISDGGTNGLPAQYFRYDSIHGQVTEVDAAAWAAAEKATINWKSFLHIGSRDWPVRFTPSEDFLMPYSDTLTLIIAAGLLLIGILTALFGSSLRQTRTVEKLLNQESEARLKAESALKMREEFLAIVSHELKTPLTPLKMQLSLFRKLVSTNVDPKSQDILKALGGADHQLGRLLALVDDLLDVTRMAAGELSLHPEHVDLAMLVNDTLDQCRLDFENAGCGVHRETMQRTEGFWDPARIRQLITILLRNAVKFGAGKPIEIRVEPVSGFAILTVRDHGIGIERKDQERIFERFERAVPAESYPGIGMGLHLARQIVLAHKGAISVDSTPGAGATFTVKLPI